MSDFFSGLKISKPEFNNLSVGEHIVKLIRAEETDSFTQFNGEAKLTSTVWRDATPQLAVTVVAAEKGKSGGLTHRLNGRGYRKYAELNDAEKKSGAYEDIDGYACSLNEDGIMVREESDTHSKECANIISQFAYAIGGKEGDKLGDVIKNAIANQTAFKVTVTDIPYQGKSQLRITKFKALPVAVEAVME